MYKKAIDLLMGMNFDAKEKLDGELAKHHPSVFVKLVGGKKKEEVMLDNKLIFIIKALNADRRVDSVKGIREYYGYCIKECLDLVKVYNGEDDIFLSSAQTATLNELRTASKMLKFADLAN